MPGGNGKRTQPVQERITSENLTEGWSEERIRFVYAQMEAHPWMFDLADISGRSSIASRLGYSYAGDRDVYEALGYKEDLDYIDYQARYLRQDIARRVVDLPVNESWRIPPEITESEDAETTFEKEWGKLVDKRRVFHYFARVDRLASLGNYAVLLLGFNDGQPLAEPVESADQLLYMMPYSQGNAKVATYEDDSTNERYGLPTSYDINHRTVGVVASSTAAIAPSRVHWTRIIHVAEDTLESDVEGIPRLERIYNRLHDLERIVGASSEMYWRGGFPIVNFKLDPQMNPKPQSVSDMQQKIEDVLHGLQRFIRTKGVDAQVISLKPESPEKQVMVQLDMIAAATDIPKRILLGSERGELSADQDERSYARTIQHRQRTHCEPVIVRQFVDRNIEVGVLPTPPAGYFCNWTDVLAVSETQQVALGKERAEALATWWNAVGLSNRIPIEVALEEIAALPESAIEKIMDYSTQMLVEEEKAEREAIQVIAEEPAEKND